MMTPRIITISDSLYQRILFSNEGIGIPYVGQTTKAQKTSMPCHSRLI